MEKVFNLNIDTKDKKIMNVTGLKQFDNNSVLYINITQNSVCFDLTECTARLNFLKENGEVLLYMADVIDAKKGKVKIKLSTQILKDPGSIKCDLSIFDKNIMKITSLDFAIQIEKSIYSNEYYLQRADFDIVQSIHIEEEKRLKNERDRIAAENKRESNETTRTKQEATRQNSENKRIEEEKKRATAENTRADNELGRITAECGRSTEEKKRATAESTRTKQENTRIAAENKREAAEKTRQAEYIKNKNLVDNFSVCQVYDPKANYKKFNRVVFNGSTYECLKECIGIDPNNTENWICIAEKGNGNMSTNTYDKNNNGKVDIAEIAEGVEWENVKNRPNVEKIEKQLKDGATKTVTREANIIDLENNVPGIANITLEGNTIDIAKESILSDFKGKTKGDTSINPNIAKDILRGSLITDFTIGNELQNTYDKISSLDNNCSFTKATKNTEIPQQLFSFNIIEIVERKLNMSIGSNTEEKVAWLKKNVTRINCNWYGYGTCPSGNIAKFNVWRSTVKSWTSFPTVETKSNVPAQISRGLYFQYTDRETIDTNGFIHFLAYTDASDGVVTSIIYTDYINIEIQLSPILKSVGEEENNQIEIKSVGKNLFDISRMNEENYSDYSSTLDNIINLKEQSIETTNNNSTTRGKGYIACVKPNTNYIISFDVVEGQGYFNISGDYNWHEQRINFQEKRKYSSVIRTSTGKLEFSLNISNSSPNSIVKIKNIQLEEGDKATEYEDYKEDKILYALKEPLRGLPNGVRDTINTDGTITRRVGKVVLNGSEKEYSVHTTTSDLIQFRLEMFKNIRKDSPSSPIICDKFNFNGCHSLAPDKEGVYVTEQINDASYKAICYIAILKSKLSTNDIDGLKKWLKENPVTVYYELAEPIIENICQPLNLKTFEGGHIVVDTEITPYVTVDYPSNINSRISSLENTEKNLKDSLGGAWKTLLILADKDLKMKSIQPLTSTDNVSKKINEIIGAWK